MKIDMQLKVMREVEENTKNLSKELKNYDKKEEAKDKEIHNVIESQENKLNERLMARRRKKKLRKNSADQIKLDDEETQPPIKKE